MSSVKEIIVVVVDGLNQGLHFRRDLRIPGKRLVTGRYNFLDEEIERQVGPGERRHDDAQQRDVDGVFGAFERVAQQRRSVTTLRRLERLQFADDAPARVVDVALVFRASLRHGEGEPDEPLGRPPDFVDTGVAEVVVDGLQLLQDFVHALDEATGWLQIIRYLIASLKKSYNDQSKTRALWTRDYKGKQLAALVLVA